jgi:hypothetical protein
MVLSFGVQSPRNALVLGTEKAKGMPRRNVLNFNPKAVATVQKIVQLAMKHALCMYHARPLKPASKPWSKPICTI